MSQVRYRKLATKDNDFDTDETDGSEILSSQFEKPPVKIPWKAIIYACVLLIGGSVLLVIGCLIVTGHIDPDEHNERFWPLIFLGAIMFIPGSYHTYFAYKVFTGDPDWSFDEFPEF